MADNKNVVNDRNESTALTSAENGKQHIETQSQVDRLWDQMSVVTEERWVNATRDQLSSAKESVMMSQENLTYQLIVDQKEPYNTTAKTLMKVLEDKQFIWLIKPPQLDTPQERLKSALKMIDKTIGNYVDSKLWVYAQKTPEMTRIANGVVKPALNWYLMEELKNRWNDANINSLTTANKTKTASFADVLNGVLWVFNNHIATFTTAKNINNAMDFLAIHQKEIQNNIQSWKMPQTLTNPLDFMQKYLKNPVWSKEENIFKLTMKDVGLDALNSDLSVWLKVEQKKEVQNIISTINVANNPKTTALVLGLSQKADEILKEQPKMQKEVLKLMDTVAWDESAFVKNGIDVVWEVMDNDGFRKVLNLVLSYIGFPWGFDGLVKQWTSMNIEKNLDDKKRKQMVEIYDYVKDLNKNAPSTTTDKTDKKNFFDVDDKHLMSAFMEKVDITQINPMTIVAMWKEGKQFLKTTQEAWKDGKMVTKFILNTDELQKNGNKEKLFVSYKDFMWKTLKENSGFIKILEEDEKEKVGSAKDNVLFAMIGGLYVKPSTVINGIKSEVFLPEMFSQGMTTETLVDAGVVSTEALESEANKERDEQAKREAENMAKTPEITVWPVTVVRMWKWQLPKGYGSGKSS